MHLSQSFDLTSYGAADSLEVFTAAVVGGLGALFGGVLGAVFLKGSEWFITSPEWRLLSSALGVLIVLLIIPGGLASLVIKIRDWYVSLVLRAATPAEPPLDIESEPVPTDTTRTDPTPTDATPTDTTRTRQAARRTESGMTAPDQSAPIVKRFAYGVRHPKQWMTDLCGGEAAFPLIVLFGLNAVDELDRTAFGVLLPEIRETFDIDISDCLVDRGALLGRRAGAAGADRPVRRQVEAHPAGRSVAPWCGRFSRA